mmetsp:Transcript_20939/g.40562  ORF Transcript_20939/g.40562 Transcript_20939/m.40562 type:complete len:279 (+) Transcript_20939:410-1246(+)
MRRLHSGGIPRTMSSISLSVAADTAFGLVDLRYMMKSNTTRSLPIASSALFGLSAAARALSRTYIVRSTVSLVPSCPLNLPVPKATSWTTATTWDSCASLTDARGDWATLLANRASSERQKRAKNRHGVHVKHPSSSITSRPRADRASGTRNGVELLVPLGDDAGEGEGEAVTTGESFKSVMLLLLAPDMERSIVGVTGWFAPKACCCCCCFCCFFVSPDKNSPPGMHPRGWRNSWSRGGGGEGPAAPGRGPGCSTPITHASKPFHRAVRHWEGTTML